MAQNKLMNPKLLALLILSIGLLILAFLYKQEILNATFKPSPSPFQRTTVDQQEFNLVITNGPIYADKTFTAKKGQLISFIIASTMAGTINFTYEDGTIIQRPIVIDPGNQFYIPSDKPGSAIINLVTDKGTYVLGTLIISN